MHLWASYPKKAAPAAGLEAWERLKLFPVQITKLMAELREARASGGWKADGGRWIPTMGRWLEQTAPLLEHVEKDAKNKAGTKKDQRRETAPDPRDAWPEKSAVKA